MPGIFVAQTPPPSRELVALRVFAATIRYLYRRGGAITRRQGRAVASAWRVRGGVT